MTLEQEAARIAAELSEAQRHDLCRRPILLTVNADACCMPRRQNTALALFRRGLINEPWSVVFALTPLGHAVRKVLQDA